MQQYKNNRNLLLLLTLGLGLSTSGCTLQRMVKTAEKHQQVTVVPSPLTTNGESVNFEMKAQVPEKLIREKEVYKLDVFYEYGNQKRENIGTYNFEFGEFVYEDRKPTITKQLSFPYAPEKSTGRLMVQGRAIDKKDNDIAYTETKQVATGLNTTPLLLVRNNDFTFTADKYLEEADSTGKLVFYFEQNQHKLDDLSEDKLKVLDQYALDNVPDQHIKIVGMRAPGEKNSNLAQKRAQTLEQQYRQRIKNLDYSGKKVSITTEVQENLVEVLQQKLETTALPKAQKQQVLAILQGEQSEQQKLQALQQTEAYAYLQKYVYPSLQAAQVEFNYNRSRRPDYELYLLAQRVANEEVDADVLTEEELQHAATLTPILAEKRKLYEAAVKTTDKWPAYYNLGVVYYDMAQKDYRPAAKKELLEKAIHNLTFAGYRNPTAKVYYSLASAYHQLGKYEQALENYTYAARLGGDEEMLQAVFADKAALEIETGRYDEAIGSLRYAGDSYQTNMNLGLSYLLKENYEGAEEFYLKALEQKPDDALAYYSLAIIGARTQNEEMLEQGLRRAVRADKSFTQKAINDMEFATYRDKQAYKDALIR
ncbi:tetratricopeptide repeat protein [Pontibacter litorisediminis]|uniref:tetratricopeptide repeat protein n=1 Tax=Pontibacter litorisediminis TaxID=1846260 RepID=UPI0023ED12DE|nr:tetratricopeptide repeat protein [Pontibacter litorisediminis]